MYTYIPKEINIKQNKRENQLFKEISEVYNSNYQKKYRTETSVLHKKAIYYLHVVKKKHTQTFQIPFRDFHINCYNTFFFYWKLRGIWTKMHFLHNRHFIIFELDGNIKFSILWRDNCVILAVLALREFFFYFLFWKYKRDILGITWKETRA